MLLATHPWQIACTSASIAVVVAFLIAALFWATDRRDLRRLVRASQFRIRSLLGVTTLVAILCGVLNANNVLPQSPSDLVDWPASLFPVSMYVVAAWLIGLALFNICDVGRAANRRFLPLAIKKDGQQGPSFRDFEQSN